MKTLERQLADYGARQLELHGPISPEELAATRSPSTPAPHDVDEPRVDYLRQPDAAPPPIPHGRRGRVAVAIAAAAALVVGIAVTASGNDRDVTTQSASSPVSTGQLTSPGVVDPVSGYEWYRVALDVATMGGIDASIHRVTVGGPGLVAVGSVGSVLEADAAIWTSVDGIAWTRVPHDEEIFGGVGIQSIEDVTIGGPGLVAVGRDSYTDDSDTYAVAAVWTSVDGTNWSRVPQDAAVFGGARREPAEVAVMTAVATGGPGLVAVGEVGGGRDMAGLTGEWLPSPVAAVWTSSDGTRWTRVPHAPDVFGTASGMTDVAPGGPGLVAVGWGEAVRDGGGAAVWTSVDGLIWTRVPHDVDVLCCHMTAVTAGGPGLVAVGVGSEIPNPSPAMETWTAVVWTSVDGLTWTRVPHDETTLGGPGLQQMTDITATGHGLVAVGEANDRRFQGATIWTSVDGVTWTRVPHDEEIFGTDWIAGVTAGGPGLVAVGNQVTVGAGGFKSRGGPAIWVGVPTD
jgi:hypothetical protein